MLRRSYPPPHAWSGKQKGFITRARVTTLPERLPMPMLPMIFVQWHGKQRRHQAMLLQLPSAAYMQNDSDSALLPGL